MTQIRPKFQRVLLKLSGEALMGNQGFGICAEILDRIAAEVKELVALNINKVDYIEIRSEDNLEIAKDYVKARIFIALYIDDIRVIDNFKLY